ncbi:uncharacterized protein B0I36DRAFT_434820 [Microdochium trichocladiopsis]|uniref:Uncharacterized protein n=1 Tax=Microdochium trichocladiopsis TaxID=1682393 RepID=A0A9P8XVS5_9PEZI|nr:uncharacterized protein B0I36DRAFT_434820 [Microdochium trichocladiopsis]KAH7020857.1 hypothetical protein B0I36DRAFT_434820 [Microdochium trichocladiopsis]
MKQRAADDPAAAGNRPAVVQGSGRALACVRGAAQGQPLGPLGALWRGAPAARCPLANQRVSHHGMGTWQDSTNLAFSPESLEALPLTLQRSYTQSSAIGALRNSRCLLDINLILCSINICSGLSTAVPSTSQALLPDGLQVTVEIPEQYFWEADEDDGVPGVEEMVGEARVGGTSVSLGRMNYESKDDNEIAVDEFFVLMRL